jgi:hypothetical protein
LTALAVVAVSQLQFNTSPAKGRARVHAAGAVQPLIGPEEQPFINRMRLVRLAGAGRSVSVASTPAPLVGPEERLFIDRCHLTQAKCGV